MKSVKDIKEQAGFDFESQQPPLSPFTNGELTKEEGLVWEIVRTHRGKDAAVLGPVIAAQTGIKYDEIRQAISGLITHHGKLIGSCSRGYYLIVAPDEVEEVYNSLRHRGISILYRASRIKKISVVEVLGQGELTK